MTALIPFLLSALRFVAPYLIVAAVAFNTGHRIASDHCKETVKRIQDAYAEAAQNEAQVARDREYKLINQQIEAEHEYSTNIQELQKSRDAIAAVKSADRVRVITERASCPRVPKAAASASGADDGGATSRQLSERIGRDFDQLAGRADQLAELYRLCKADDAALRASIKSTGDK